MDPCRSMPKEPHQFLVAPDSLGQIYPRCFGAIEQLCQIQRRPDALEPISEMSKNRHALIDLSNDEDTQHPYCLPVCTDWRVNVAHVVLPMPREHWFKDKTTFADCGVTDLYIWACVSGTVPSMQKA